MELESIMLRIPVSFQSSNYDMENDKKIDAQTLEAEILILSSSGKKIALATAILVKPWHGYILCLNHTH